MPLMLFVVLVLRVRGLRRAAVIVVRIVRGNGCAMGAGQRSGRRGDGHGGPAADEEEAPDGRGQEFSVEHECKLGQHRCVTP